MWVSIKKKENANAAWRTAIQTYTKLANTGPTDNTVSHVKRESQLKKKKKRRRRRKMQMQHGETQSKRILNQPMHKTLHFARILSSCIQ